MPVSGPAAPAVASAAALTLAAIAAQLGGELLGDPATRILRLAPLQAAVPGDIAFLSNPAYRKFLQTTAASAVILHPSQAGYLQPGQAAILTANPYVYYARVAALLHPAPARTPSVHASAVTASRIPEDAAIGPQVQVGANVRLGARVTLHAGAVIGDGVTIGDDSVIHAHVTIYPGCLIGARALIHSGAVIGADGFGFAPDFGEGGSNAWVKIPQVGRVVIGDDVEIGANTSIDRGALEDTVIGDGCKLDNQIQIGHNCVIGEHTVIAGCVGIAGSARIGHHCAIGGAAMILGHLEIAPHCEISPGSMVMKSIREPGKYTALYPLERHDDWRRNAVLLRHLDRMQKRIAALEAASEAVHDPVAGIHQRHT